MSLKLIEDKVAFVFLEDVENRSFTGKTESGIIVKRDHENQVKDPRWGVVLKTSSNVTEVTDGDYILIEPLGWTNGMEFEEVSEDKFWVTTESRIMAVSREEPQV